MIAFKAILNAMVKLANHTWSASLFYHCIQDRFERKQNETLNKPYALSAWFNVKLNALLEICDESCIKIIEEKAVQELLKFLNNKKSTSLLI